MVKDSKIPLISVIVPVFNVSKYLNRCIQSVLNQTYKNFELLLIDDGSTDRSPEICDNFGKKDTRVKIFHNKNGGASKARNFGIKEANGDYITFIDSDDIVSPLYLERLFILLIKNDADISSVQYYKIYDYNIIPTENNISQESTVYDSNRACSELLTTQRVYTMPWGKLYRKEIFNYAEFPEGRTSEDTVTICKFLYATHLNKNRIAVSQEKLYYYYKHEGTCSSVKSLKNFTDALWAKVERARFFNTKKEIELTRLAWKSAVSCAIYQFIDCADIKGWHIKWFKYACIYLFEAKVSLFLKTKVFIAFVFPHLYKKCKTIYYG